MSKFSSNHSPGFDLVCAAIQTYVYSAPKYIRSRWTEERPKEKLQNNVPSITTIRPKTTRYSALGCLPYVDEFSRTETPHTTNQLSRDRPGMLLSVTKELGDSYCNPRDLQLNPAYEFSSTSGIPGGPVPNPPHVLGHEGIHSMRDGETIGMHASVDNVHDTSDRSQAILRSNTIEHSGLDVLRSTTSNQKTHHKQGPASSSSSRTDGGNRVFNTLSRSAVHVVSPAEDNMLAEKPQGILQESQDNHKYTKEPILLDYGIAPLEYSRLSFFSESYPSTGIHPSQQPPMARERARPSSRGSVDNYAPRDHQMQLMLLEQQSKKRALIARQEQASLSSGVEPVVPSQFSTVPPHFMKDEEHTPGDTTLDLALVQQTQQEQRMPQVMQMEPQRRMQRREQFIITPQMRTHSALLETSSSWPSKRAAMCMPKDAEPTAERLNGADTKSTELIAGQPTIEAKQDSAFSSNAIYADFLPSSNISFNTTDEGDVLDHFDFVSFFEDSYGERDRGNLEPFQRELKCNTASLQRWNVDRGHREGYGAPESGTAPLWAAADSGRDNNGYGQQNVGVTPWQQQAAPPPLGGYGNYQGYGNDNEYATSKGIPPELAVLDLGARATLNILLQSKVNNDHEAKSYGDPIPPDELVMFSPSISVLNKPNTLCTNVENNTDRPALMYMATPNRNRGSTSPLDEMGRKISMKRAAKPAQGDAGLVNKMANNQYPHLVLENSPQKVSPSYESVSDEGEVSYGKRKRGQEMQDVESVVSSELQVQNEQRSIPELSTEVQARGKPMGFSGNFSKMRDCSIPTMLSPSRTDFDPETYRLSHTRTTLLRAEATKGPEKSQNAASWREPSKMMIENLQGLDATEAEISRAKEEIFKLLRQWTTCDSSTWTDGTIQVM
ncbi:hypothetical protein MMC18_007674 [Xylographa bjoerkii]|nr:hypothetical protein [Xylographa bjoerkii]